MGRLPASVAIILAAPALPQQNAIPAISPIKDSSPQSPLTVSVRTAIMTQELRLVLPAIRLVFGVQALPQQVALSVMRMPSEPYLRGRVYVKLDTMRLQLLCSCAQLAFTPA